MESLSLLHIIGIVSTLLIMVAVGIHSGKKVKNAADFATGGHRAGTAIVVGTITGTLVGGSSTIGTAQLAFKYGLSAWWFTLGGGLGCLIMGTLFLKQLRNGKYDTIQQMVASEFGPLAGVITSALSTIGMLLVVVAQILSANALLTTIFPLTAFQSAIITVILMTFYVVFGGVLGTGALGIMKVALLYVSVVGSAVLVYLMAGGFSTFYGTLPHQQYFNLFARGFGKDAGAGLSLILGVLCTQTYIQAVVSAKNNATARRGALISAAIIPPIGVGGILVGLYMRVNYPSLEPAKAFVEFIMKFMNPLLGGVILATLLIAVIGTGSGIALGTSTIIINNIYKKYINKNADGSKATLLVSRIIILCVLVIALLFSLGNIGSVILNWSFMSMALRGAVMFIPMCAAMFFPGRVDAWPVITASIIGTVTVIVGNLFNIVSFDPLILGIGVSLIIALIGAVIRSHTIKTAYDGLLTIDYKKKRRL